MSAHLNEHERQVIDRAEKFASEFLAPRVADWERTKTHAAEGIKAAGDWGLSGFLTPQEHGGLGLGLQASVHLVRAFASQCMGFTLAYVVHDNRATNIALHGTDQMRERFVPGLISGDLIGSFLLTEPGAGSDAAAIQCLARPDGDGWVLNGEKAWITNAAGAHVLTIYTQTDPELGPKGIAGFVIEADREGVERLPSYDMVGGHAAGVGGFRFNDVRLTKDDLLYPAGQALKRALGSINNARVFVAAQSTGMMQASLNRAVEYTKSRQAFGQHVADFQGIQWMLADVQTDLEAAKLLTERAAQLIDAGEDAQIAASHAKKFATRAASARIADCAQVMGANGAKIEEPTARHFNCTRLMQYMDGATEVQNLILARALFA